MPAITATRYAVATSTLALVVAVGGTSYAAVKIGTKQLKNNAVTSAKIKNRTITGKDLNLAKLGVVNNADTANHAIESSTLDGGITVTTIDQSESSAPGRQQYIYVSHSLDIAFDCLADTSVELTATTSRSGSNIATVAVSDGGPTVRQEDEEDDDFAPGDAFDLLAGDDGDTSMTTFVYRDPAGSVVQGTLYSDVGAGPVRCKVYGTIIAKPPTS